MGQTRAVVDRDGTGRAKSDGAARRPWGQSMVSAAGEEKNTRKMRCTTPNGGRRLLSRGRRSALLPQLGLPDLGSGDVVHDPALVAFPRGPDSFGV